MPLPQPAPQLVPALKPHHALAAVALAVLQMAATAQTAAPAAPAGQLQTITVTAERRVENIREVPSSVSALQGEVLDVLTSSGQDIRLLSGRVPSLNIESSFGRAFPRVYIRGYGNTDFRLNASQPVSLVYDDVVQENPILKGFPVFDMDRIEVLRGPQGTLFGRNTPAGVVKFDSVKPSNNSEGYGSLSFGTYKTINAEGAVNVPLGAGMSARVSLLNQTRDDWVTNTYSAGPSPKLEGYRDSALRAQLLYEPDKNFSLLANVHGRDFKGSSRLFRANIIQPGTNNLVAGFDPARVSYDGQNSSDLQNYGANLRLRIGLGDLTLYSITGLETVRTYSRGDIDGGSPPYNFSGGAGSIPFLSETADGMPKHRQFTQELRLESAYAGPMNWQAGVFLFSEDYKVESFDYDSSNGGKQDEYERVRQKNDAYALFAATDYALTPAFKVRGGLRWTHDKKQFNVEDYNCTTFVCGSVSTTVPKGPRTTLAQLASYGPLSASPSDNKLSWDLSGSYALDKDTNVYARYATGFRGASVQGAGNFNDQSVAKPETNTSFEAGVKADLLNRRARLSFSVFSYEVKDLQLTAVGGAGNANILLNAKKATGQGFELDLQAYATDKLLATLGVGLNDTKIKDPGLAVSPCGTTQYVFGQPGAPRPNCTVTNPLTADGKALIDGNPLPQAPKVTTSFTLKYSQPVANGEVYAFTDWVYRSKVNFFLYQAVEYTGKALTEGGLRVGYTWGNGKYDLAAFGRNITNQIRIVGGIDFDNLTGFINDPRTYGVQFKASF
jgi:iron complex outermembrane receptor protein